VRCRLDRLRIGARFRALRLLALLVVQFNRISSSMRRTAPPLDPICRDERLASGDFSMGHRAPHCVLLHARGEDVAPKSGTASAEQERKRFELIKISRRAENFESCRLILNSGAIFDRENRPDDVAQQRGVAHIELEQRF
jgi:hypothetical protein